MSGVIPLIVPGQGAPFHGGGRMNATRWSAIWRNVVTAPTNPPTPPSQKAGLQYSGGFSGGGKREKFTMLTEGLKGVRDSSGDS